MSKRANNEGSIYRRTDGRWAAGISLGNGRRKHFYGKTRQEVAQKLTAALKAKQDGLPLPSERQTVRTFLAHWLETVRPSLRPSTWTRYALDVNSKAIPNLGTLPLGKLGAAHLQRLYAQRLAAGDSPKTVVHLHAVLHRALAHAAQWDMVVRNVADLVSRPRVPKREMTTLNADQVSAFFDALDGERLEALYVLAVSTGMREGELLALRWQDVDLNAASLQVRATLTWGTGGAFSLSEPKTKSSQRQILLTSMEVEKLRQHRRLQAEERLRLGSAWEDLSLVFANEVGRPILPQNLVRRSFRRILDRAGLPHVRFHDLRHTAATLLLGRGVHAKIVSEMLGHSQIGITLDTYSHVLPTMQKDAVRAREGIQQVDAR
jgi:integrase